MHFPRHSPQSPAPFPPSSTQPSPPFPPLLLLATPAFLSHLHGIWPSHPAPPAGHLTFASRVALAMRHPGGTGPRTALVARANGPAPHWWQLFSARPSTGAGPCAFADAARQGRQEKGARCPLSCAPASSSRRILLVGLTDVYRSSNNIARSGRLVTMSCARNQQIG